MGVGAAAEETPSLTGEFVEETHKGLECAQDHPFGISTRGAQFDCGCAGTLYVGEGVQ